MDSSPKHLIKSKIFREKNYRITFEEKDGKSDPKKRFPKASVSDLVKVWNEGGIEAVKAYLQLVKVFEDTWEHKIKTLLEKGSVLSAEEEIRLVDFNINLKKFL